MGLPRPHTRYNPKKTEVEKHYSACFDLANKGRTMLFSEKITDETTKTLLEEMVKKCSHAEYYLLGENRMPILGEETVNSCYDRIGALSYAFNRLNKINSTLDI